MDRRHDKHLRAMAEEAAEAVARAGGVGGGLAPFQALANVVAGHMGGALVSALWCIADQCTPSLFGRSRRRVACLRATLPGAWQTNFAASSVERGVAA